MAARFVRDEEAAGSNPATPTTKLQVTARFRDGFRLPLSAVSRFWERTGADLAQPTSLTSGSVLLFVRCVGAAAPEGRIRLLVRPTPGRTGCGLTWRLPALIHPSGMVKLRPQPRCPLSRTAWPACPPPLVCRICRSSGRGTYSIYPDRSGIGPALYPPARRVITHHDDHIRFRHGHAHNVPHIRASSNDLCGYSSRRSAGTCWPWAMVPSDWLRVGRGDMRRSW